MVVNERVEHLEKSKYDVITARGVASVLKLIKLTKRVSRETLLHVFIKERDWEKSLRS